MLKGCPGAIVFKDARPDYIACPHCGEEMEIWSDELLARCPHCHLWVSKSGARRVSTGARQRPSVSA